MKLSLWQCAAVSLLLISTCNAAGYDPQCGEEAKNSLCPSNLCCSNSGWCGTGSYYCGTGCQSQCGSPEEGVGARRGVANASVPNIITKEDFTHMFKHTSSCRTDGFYTYDSFLKAIQSFKTFGTTGDTTTKKREIAAFFAQISHETSGGWLNAIDGPYSWGFCFVTSPDRATFCNPRATQWPCARGKKYYGRGAFQIKFNENYGAAGKALGLNLLGNPDVVATDPVVSFQTALWFWTTAKQGRPSGHDVMTGIWKPSAADRTAGRLPGFGVTTNIINGVAECGHGEDSDQDDRIGFYKRYCDILGVGYGNDLDCGEQKPF